MGYSERSCYICCGRFNMARLRRADEPQNLAWDIHRDDWRPGEDPNGDEHSPNPVVVTPKRVNGQIVGYECNGKFTGFYVAGEGIEPGSACEKAGCSEEDGDHACGGPECGFVMPGGKGAYSLAGYNGWRISDEEMRTMTCVQVATTDFDSEEWRAEEDDDEYETSEVVLTAVSESAPNEFDVSHVPYRHGIGGTILIDDGGYADGTWGVPFHGTCYLVMKKMTRKLDIPKEINLLTAMVIRRNREYHPVTSSPDVGECADQFWVHIPGTEYLAANPWHIPGLHKILEECIKPEAVWPEVYSIKSRERYSSTDTGSSCVRRDLFLILPPELRLLLLDHLQYKEIAALRQVTRAYRVLPQRFFRDLVIDRMPWVWEVHELEVEDNKVDWFELWSKLSRADGGVGKGSERKSFKLERPEEGLGSRVNGLVNRRRIWCDAGSLINSLVEMQEELPEESESRD